MARDQWRVDLASSVEVAIGLNVDCGGTDGVYRVRDAVLADVMPHIEAAFKRGHEAGSSRAGYRLVQENERLRRELEQARKGLT